MVDFRRAVEEAKKRFADAAIWAISIAILGSMVRLFSRFMFFEGSLLTAFDVVNIVSLIFVIGGLFYTVRLTGFMGGFGYAFALIGGEGAFIGLLHGQSVVFFIGIVHALLGGYIIINGRQFKK